MLYVSPSCVQITGYAAEEFLDDPTLIDRIIHPDDRVLMAEHLHKLGPDGRRLPIDFRIICRDGTERWIGHQCQPVRDENGRDLGVRGSNRDITEQKRIDTTLGRSERRYRTLFETLADSERKYRELVQTANSVVLRWGRDGIIHFINEPGAHLLGYEPEELIGRSVQTLVPEVESTGRDLSSLVQDILDRPEQYLYSPNENLRKDGTRVWVAWTNKAITDDDGSVREVLAIGNEITSLKAAEAALRDSEERLRVATESARAGMWSVDIPSQRWQFSAQTAKVFGLGDDAPATFEQITALTHPEDREQLAEQSARALRRAGTHEFEYRIVRPDGAVRWVLLRGRTDADAEGRPWRNMGVVMDITERKTTERALQEANEQLQAQAEELAAINEELQTQTEELQRQTLELRQSEARMRAMLDHIPVGIWFTDSDGKIIYGNEAGHSIWAGARYVGPEAFHEYKAWWFETGEPVMPEDWAVVRAVRKGETSLNEILEIECFDGTRKIIRNSAVPMRSPGGEILGCVILNEEITDRIRAQQALTDREQRLRTALEGGQMGLWEWDVEKDAAIWDERICELLGVGAPDPVNSEAFFRCVYPDDRDRLRADLAEALRTGGDFHREFRAVRPDGEIVWLASRSTVVCDEQGRGVRMLGILFDVTLRKQMEEALRRMNDELEKEVQVQTEELKSTVVRLKEEVLRRRLAEKDLEERSQLLEGFFRNTITPLAFMDRQFNFVRVNDAYARADGKTPEQFVGKNHFDLYPHAENRAIFEEVVRTKQLHFALARPFTYAEDPERGISYWNWQLTPLLDEAGEVQYLVLNLQDVTERQTAMEELKMRTSQLQRLTAELSETEDRERHRLAELLHDDLQQLLVGSKLRLSMLTRKTQEMPEIYEPIQEAIDLLAESIQKSRGLSHELSPPVLHHGNLAEVLRWLGEQIYTTCGLKVHLRVADDADIHSQPLKTFAYKTVREMLFNVVKHANVKRAAVVVRRVDQAIRVTVADRGRGFDPQRLEVASQNGFGLFHIRERLQLLGGALTVRSAPGRGSRFVLTIPLDMTENAERHENHAPAGANAAANQDSPLRPGDRMGRRKFRILIVDDHKVMRDGLAALLAEEPDIEVVGQAGNGREAITLTAQRKPDVVVMDVVMPIINGEEATRQIKQRWPEVRIVALSMLEEDATRERMREAGAEAFVSKAGPSEVIAAAIRGAS